MTEAAVTTEETTTQRNYVPSKGSWQFEGVPKGFEPRPVFVDYKDIGNLRRFLTPHGKIMSRNRTGLSAAYQKAVTDAVKRARFMGLLPYVGDK